MKNSKPAPPANIVEFNRIAALVFAQLYAQFPAPVDIDRQAIATAFGVEGNDWGVRLPSGRSFSDLLSLTVGWLNHQGYIVAFGAHSAANVMLTEKGVAALSEIPEGLGSTVGAALVKAETKPHGWDWSQVGELIGGVFAGAAKGFGSS